MSIPAMLITMDADCIVKMTVQVVERTINFLPGCVRGRVLW